MVRSCVQAIWCVKQLNLPLDVKVIILMKVREAFEQEMKEKNNRCRLMVVVFMLLNVELKGLVVAIDVEDSPVIQ